MVEFIAALSLLALIAGIAILILTDTMIFSMAAFTLFVISAILYTGGSVIIAIEKHARSIKNQDDNEAHE